MKRAGSAILFLVLGAVIVLPFQTQAQTGEVSPCKAEKGYGQDRVERERLIAKADREEYNVRRVAFFIGLMTRDETVRRTIFLNEGDIFTRGNLELSLRNLSELDQFIDPGRIEDVQVTLNETFKFIDFSIYFLEKRSLTEVDHLVGKDLYAAALYASLEKMQEEWGRDQGTDYTQAIVIGKKEVTSKIPSSHNNFTAIQPGLEELEARFVSSGEPLRVFEVSPYVRVGSSIRIRVEVKYYSKTEKGFKLALSDRSDVYLSRDWETDRLKVKAICLDGI